MSAPGGAARGAVGEVSGHVLIIIQNLPLRLDRRVRNECRALIRAGYRVSVICPKEEPDEADHHQLDGAAVYSYRAPPGAEGAISYAWEFIVCWWRSAWLSVQVNRRRRIHILQACNPPDTYWLLAALWKIWGRRFVFDQHDLCPEVYEARFGKRGVLYRTLLWLERRTYSIADVVISPNPAYREVAMRRGEIPSRRTAVVMSTPDAQRMYRSTTRPELRGGFKHLVCYVGIMGPQDGVDSLLAAIDAYVHELGREDTRFALLGFGDSFKQLRQESTRRGLDRWVIFTGRVDHEELGRWLSTADLGVTPDPQNEFNHRSTMNKTLEYMAHEVAVVATDLRETRRCAADAAVYVPGDDPLTTAGAIAAVLDDPERRVRMGRHGRERIETELAWSIQERRYIRVFDSVMASLRR